VILLIDKNYIDIILEGSFIKANNENNILWIEYIDVECLYCATFNNF